MDEPRRPEDVCHDPIDDLDRMVGLPQLDEPGRRAARAGQLDAVTVQPNHEDFGLDGPLHIEAA
jgi:hypothetical protein